MSLERIRAITSDIPTNLRNQVISYAECVERALPDIFLEIGRTPDRERADTVVFWAGLRKLYGIITATYWTLENSIQLLERSDVGRIRIGSSDFSRGSETYEKIRRLFVILEREEERLSFRHLIEATPKDVLLRTYEE